jgi:outer membrane protein OmpA-like peptidoglycan-associated protein
MTGLMMIFMLIAISYMLKVEADSAKIKEIAVLYERMKSELYIDLKNEFQNDLPKWGAELDQDMTIRFKEPEVLFGVGQDELKPRFQAILSDFFPRYVRILTSERYKNSISEIRIEGHTSSFWIAGTSDQDSYFKNMSLSQARTRTTLEYVMSQPAIGEHLSWLRRYVTANGLSSSRLVQNSDGSENYARSQRVEFRVRTDSESRIAKIIETVQ